jgi:hypothetical protein
MITGLEARRTIDAYGLTVGITPVNERIRVDPAGPPEILLGLRDLGQIGEWRCEHRFLGHVELRVVVVDTAEPRRHLGPVCQLDLEMFVVCDFRDFRNINAPSVTRARFESELGIPYSPALTRESITVLHHDVVGSRQTDHAEENSGSSSRWQRQFT